MAAPEEPTGGEAGDPGFDPGGETALPFETAPVPPTPDGNGDDGQDHDQVPLEVEPDEDPDARLVPPSEPDSLAFEESDPVPPMDVVAPGEPSAPVDPNFEAPEATPPAQQPPNDQVVVLAPRSDRPDSRPDRLKEGAARDRSGPDQRGSGRGSGVERVALAQADPAELAETEPESGAGADPVAQTGGPPAASSEGSLRNERFHVVAPGDSLWSIAKRMLGRDPSIAQIARQVDRLWSLNEDRIATGDPDLLMVGTRLRLR